MPIGSVKSGVSITYLVGVVDLIPGDGLKYFFFRCSSNMARIGAKLCQNAFQRIPDVSFFDAQKKDFRRKFGSGISFFADLVWF